MTTRHAPVTDLATLLALDVEEIVDGYRSAEADDPEPGMNRSRAFHHGWRVRQMDRGALPIDDQHRALTRAYVLHQRSQGLAP